MNGKNSFNRRKVLKTAGASLAATSAIGVVYGEKDIEVVTAVRGDTPVESEFVSQKWMDHENKVTRKLNKFRKELKNDQRVKEIELGVANEWVGGRPGSRIEIAVKPGSDGPDVPKEEDEVEIKKKTAKTRRFAFNSGCQSNSNYFADLPGGVLLQSSEGNVDRYGTSAYLSTWNGSQYMLSVSHLWGLCEDNDQESAYHKAKKIGTVTAAHIDHDWSLVNKTTSNIDSLTSGIFDPADKNIHNISARFTTSGLRTAMQDNRTVFKVGIETGRTRGTILNVEGNGGIDSCTSWDGNGMKTGCTVADGDSGGPIYAKGKNNSNNFVVAGIVSGGLDFFIPGESSACNNNELSPNSTGMSAHGLATVHGIKPVFF
ncbi:hypothetical protein [Haladaptatus sp. NG-SE-30]